MGKVVMYRVDPLLEPTDSDTTQLRRSHGHQVGKFRDRQWGDRLTATGGDFMSADTPRPLRYAESLGGETTHGAARKVGASLGRLACRPRLE